MIFSLGKEPRQSLGFTLLITSSTVIAKASLLFKLLNNAFLAGVSKLPGVSGC